MCSSHIFIPTVNSLACLPLGTAGFESFLQGRATCNAMVRKSGLPTIFFVILAGITLDLITS